MVKRIECLNPARKLVDAVVDWLVGASPDAGHVRLTPTGALSLDHVMVVVPTAQSGRSLRLALARRFEGRGLLPPRVVLPMQLLVPADDALRTASAVQLRAAFLKFLETRPARATVDGRVELREWTHLFRAEYISDARSHLSFFDQLSDIWRILAGGGLVMRDVRECDAARAKLAEALGDESVRWDELAEFETAFFDFLHARGLRHEVEGLRLAKSAARPVDAAVEEIVLPALVDPVSVLFDVLAQQRDGLTVHVLIQASEDRRDTFDAWGRPTIEGWTGESAPVSEAIRDGDVVRTGTDGELAKRVAADFPRPDSGCARPALGLCDEELFPELVASFLNIGYELHNPERHAVSASSLGRLVDNLVSLYAARAEGLAFEPLVALLREDDVMEPVLHGIPRAGKDDRPQREEVLEGLDICRNAFLPRVLPRDFAFDTDRLAYFERPRFETFVRALKSFAALFAAAESKSANAAQFVREMLGLVYANRPVTTAAKEFCQAASAVRDVLGQFDAPEVAALGLEEGALTGLLRKSVAEASYSLEPDSPRALKSEGWLELSWSAADKVALVGFNEGCVPDAVAGHAFLPDSLREALGLLSNARRLARDTCILTGLLAARAAVPGSVRVYLSQTNDAGDLHRPSRLLFLVPPARLADRTCALFGDLPPGEAMPGRRLAPAWVPRLPTEVAVHGKSKEYPEGRLTASAIDAWLKCPFAYFLEYGVGMRRVKEKKELEAADFGNIVHRALEIYANEQLELTAAGASQLSGECQIAAAFRRIMAAIRKSYGAHPSANLVLQLDAAEKRLTAFARIQAKWAAEGWRVAEKPEFAFVARPFEGEADADMPIRGSVDRIDYREGYGYRLVDYKTWDARQGAAARILKGGEREVAHARKLALPLVGAAEDGSGGLRFLSVQLPLYGRCLEKVEPRFAGRIADYCYVVLGETAEDVCVLMSADDQGEFEAVKTKSRRVALRANVAAALDTARIAIRRIRGNFFWPPGPSDVLRYDLKDVFLRSPAHDLPCDGTWRKAQEEKLRKLAEEEVPA